MRFPAQNNKITLFALELLTLTTCWSPFYKRGIFYGFPLFCANINFIRYRFRSIPLHVFHMVCKIVANIVFCYLGFLSQNLVRGAVITHKLFYSQLTPHLLLQLFHIGKVVCLRISLECYILMKSLRQLRPIHSLFISTHILVLV